MLMLSLKWSVVISVKAQHFLLATLSLPSVPGLENKMPPKFTALGPGLLFPRV